MTSILSDAGRCVTVAIDHPLYSWPHAGLEDSKGLLEAVSRGGADAVIASYGTIRDKRLAFGDSQPVLKLDLTTLSMDGSYPPTEYVVAYTLEDALRLGASAVLTYVQLGTSFELDALRTAGQVAAEADALGLEYVCEIMPIQSHRFPDPEAPEAIAAACRTATELGAAIIKTTMPRPASSLAEFARYNRPILIAGGSINDDQDDFVDSIRTVVAAGAAGVAVGRNVWSSASPEETVRALCDVVHRGGSGNA